MEATVSRTGIRAPVRLRTGGATLNPGNLSAGLVTVLVYAFGPVPFYFATAAAMGVDSSAAGSGFFVVFLTAGVFSTVLSVLCREPAPLGWSLAGLVYMAAEAGSYTPGEMAGATLVAGLTTLAIAVSGISGRIAAATPLAVVMGVFAGNSLDYSAGTASAAGAEPLMVGAALVGYFGARRLARPWLPPIAGALVTGLPVVMLSGRLESFEASFGLPALVPVTPAFEPGSFLALSLPLVVLAAGVGNLQSLGMLRSYGFAPRSGLLTGVTGLMTLVHAAFGAPPAQMQTSATPILAGNDAGPPEHRWLAVVIASVGAIVIGCAATSVSAFIAAVPPAFVQALLGLVLLPVVAGAIRASVSEGAGIAGVVALAVAASGLELFAVGASFWALVAGVVVLKLEPKAGAGA